VIRPSTKAGVEVRERAAYTAKVEPEVSESPSLHYINKSFCRVDSFSYTPHAHLRLLKPLALCRNTSCKSWMSDGDFG
jgi:hypothetical protein